MDADERYIDRETFCGWFNDAPRFLFAVSFSSHRDAVTVFLSLNTEVWFISLFRQQSHCADSSMRRDVCVCAVLHRRHRKRNSQNELKSACARSAAGFFRGRRGSRVQVVRVRTEEVPWPLDADLSRLEMTGCPCRGPDTTEAQLRVRRATTLYQNGCSRLLHQTARLPRAVGVLTDLRGRQPST